MNVIVCGDEVFHGKPSPDIFLLAASKLGLQPYECLVFEDSLSGVIAGTIIITDITIKLIITITNIII